MLFEGFITPSFLAEAWWACLAGWGCFHKTHRLDSLISNAAVLHHFRILQPHDDLRIWFRKTHGQALVAHWVTPLLARRSPDKNQRLAGNTAVATSNQSWMKMTTNTPLIFDTLCEGNMIRNNSAGFDLKKTFSFAIRGTNYENCPKPVDDQGYDTAILPVNPDLLHSLAKTNKPSAKE